MGASRLGVVVCGWAAAVLVQGEIVFMLQTKDRMFVTVMFLLICFRYWHNICPQATDGSLTETGRSLSANNSQQLALPIHFVSRLFYWCKLVSAMTSVVLSMMRLASHDFGQTEVENKATRDFALKVFYVVALVEALVLLFALTFVTIIAMQRTVTGALFEWVWRRSSLPSLSDLSPNDPPLAWEQPSFIDEPGVAESDIHNWDISDFWQSNNVVSDIACSDDTVSDRVCSDDTVSDIACSDDTVSDIACSDDAISDIAISESDDLACLESYEMISLRHPHSDFEFELIN